MLRNAALEVKSGPGRKLVAQMLREQAATDLPVLGYGPDLSERVMRAAQRAGLLVTRDKDLLIEVVKPP